MGWSSKTRAGRGVRYVAGTDGADTAGFDIVNLFPNPDRYAVLSLVGPPTAPVSLQLAELVFIRFQTKELEGYE